MHSIKEFMNVIQKVLTSIVHVTKLPSVRYFRFPNLKIRKGLEPSGFFRFLLRQKAEVAVHM